MEVGKLKTIALIILILVNISFAAIIISNYIKSADISAREKEGLVTALGKLGVEVSKDKIPEDTDFFKYTVIRDREAEAQIAGSLLGSSEAEDLGGNIYLYETQKGQAQFRGNGNFEVTITKTTLTDTDIVNLIAPQNKTRHDNAYISVYNGVPVFNCVITIMRSETDDIKISGCRLPGTPQNETAAKTLSSATILLRFVNDMESEGIIFKQIKQMTKGYLLADTVSSLELKPVWQIETDGGIYYVDASEGTLLDF